MKLADVVRSFEAYLETALAGLQPAPTPPLVDEPQSEVGLHKQGEEFLAHGQAKWWIKPRLSVYESPQTSRALEEEDDLSWLIDGFCKIQRKGGRFLNIYELADIVRAIVDPSEGAPITVVIDDGGAPPVNIGVMTFGEVIIEFTYETTVVVRESTIPDVDMFTMTFSAHVSRAEGDC